MVADLEVLVVMNMAAAVALELHKMMSVHNFMEEAAQAVLVL